MPSDPIHATTIDANFHKLRAIVAREPQTLDEIEAAMGIPRGNVYALLIASGEYFQEDGKWKWKGFKK